MIDLLFVLAAAVALWVLSRRFRSSPDRWPLNLLEKLLPVFSAETVAGREAEFIRDSLPKRTTVREILYALLLLAAGALIWWLGR